MSDIVVLEPTLACNLACPMCDRSLELRHGASEASLSPKKYIDAVRPLIGKGKEFYISGGEPTLWPGLVALCKEIIDGGAKVSLQTNGTKPKMISALLDVGVTSFNLSIDGPGSVHDSIRGQGNYKLMCETAAAINASSKGHYVTTTVLSGYNLSSVEKIFAAFRRDRISPSLMIFELARIFDAEAIRLSADLAGCETKDVAVKVANSRNFDFTLEELKNAVERLKRLGRSYRRKITFFPDKLPQQIKLYYEYQTRKGRDVFCKHRSTLRVDSWANVIPCFTFRNTLGNLLHDDLEAIAKKSALFWDQLEERNLAPVCDTCFRLS